MVDLLDTGQSWSTLPASDPNSPFYVPPIGTYQNNAGQIVPKNTVSQTSSTPASSNILSASTLGKVASGAMNLINPSTLFARVGFDKLGLSLEDVIFILLGILLIAAGLFAFRSTQTIIQNTTDTVSRVARRAGETAAAVSA